jgi:murein DD-endopeptidase MepM/ murein hydrolase activator NlpD
MSAGVILAGVSFAFPSTVGAFWPFKDTHAAGNPTPLLHDPSLNLLVAPEGTEVDDEIDPTAFTTSDGMALIPDSTGNGEIATDTESSSDNNTGDDTLTTPNNGAISQYTVKSGDSLSEIAQNYGVSVNTILWANNITDKSTIKAGTVLVILPVSGIQHTVRSGDTLSSLAAKFGADAGDIAQFNGLPADGSLQAGSTIIIPGGELPSSAESSSPSSSHTTKTSSNTKGTTSSSFHTAAVTSKPSSSSVASSGSNLGKMNYSDESGNPYRGGGGSALHGFFVNPLPGALLTQGLHGIDAVDLGAPSGTSIHAAAAGTVILARTGGWNGGYGNYVILDNGHGVETLYAHMSEVKAEVGSTVSAGEVIGYVGMTGDATGPHLHFEVRGAQNPFSYCEEMTVCADPS